MSSEWRIPFTMISYARSSSICVLVYCVFLWNFSCDIRNIFYDNDKKSNHNWANCVEKFKSSDAQSIRNFFLPRVDVEKKSKLHIIYFCSEARARHLFPNYSLFTVIWNNWNYYVKNAPSRGRKSMTNNEN